MTIIFVFFFLVDLCLVYENQSTMKKEDSKWQDGRDICWQVSALPICTSHYYPS